MIDPCEPPSRSPRPAGSARRATIRLALNHNEAVAQDDRPSLNK